MADTPSSPLKDKNYNLVWAVHQSLENVWRLETFIQDAEREGDQELADWLRRIQENNKKAGEQGKRMLVERLQRENG
ncbi:hypothetical protein ACFPZ0_05045 [Streptomonospora nanhaiensis]|uniref:Uncharacterized protein n=1 Tax=Streptomonospora nanhaiensis TaxID=1323731 RepID=A0A853BPB3_9ACTN|nr:hypothetical protein [Streptomonospora nanhaiensis]MBV2364015.1 hypothetical protein [Streptomonospora nanhaiensis]MBX9387359.1 hypothetical protein [Streptomonospora nanhaiensis]NYI97013.1 hypothetical protein [Streptomonospora nanhaiensis]